MVKKQRKKENAPPEKVVSEKLQGVLMWILRNVLKGVKRLRIVRGRSKKES